MNTFERLDGVYRKAKKVTFDEHSKLVFVSDCHRGDDSISDEFARNQTLMLAALQYYYDQGYTYVEAGDGDELIEYGNFQNIRSAHIDVLTVLKEFYKEHRFYMLYGNHNLFLRHPEYVRKNYYYYFDEYLEEQRALFPNLHVYEGILLRYKPNNQKILVVHGHQGDLMNDQLWLVSLILLRYFWRFVHVVGFKNPSSPARNQFKQHKIEKIYSRWLESNDLMLICGHTHRLKFPKEGDLPYFNTGCCIHTKGITVLEILEGKIMIVQWRIVADKKGVLRTQRTIIRGPEYIEKYQRTPKR